jgi:hypothetical protein
MGGRYGVTAGAGLIESRFEALHLHDLIQPEPVQAEGRVRMRSGSETDSVAMLWNAIRTAGTL